MNTKEIKELIAKRFDLFEILHNCKSSTNEIIFREEYMISLSKLKNSLDYEKYPELVYLFSEENISYLQPYYDKIINSEDLEMGLVKAKIITSEIVCLVGIDLTGRDGADVNYLCSKKDVELAKKHLEGVGITIKPITYLDEIINIRLFWANNKQLYSTRKNISNWNHKKIIFDKRDNSLAFYEDVVYANGEQGIWSYKDNVYDILYPFYRDLKDDLVISNEIFDEDCYFEMEELEIIELEEAIKRTIYSGIGKFEGNKFIFEREEKDYYLVYDGKDDDINDFTTFVINQMKSFKEDDSNIVFLYAFAKKINEVCFYCEVVDLDNFLIEVSDMFED